MRSIDLALYADMLAGEAASLAARVERERGRLRQETVERAARAELPAAVVERLEDVGLLRTRGDPASLAELEEALDAVELLQAWVEARLAAATSAEPTPVTLGTAVVRRGREPP
jgi:hypothetical protein